MRFHSAVYINTWMRIACSRCGAHHRVNRVGVCGRDTRLVSFALFYSSRSRSRQPATIHSNTDCWGLWWLSFNDPSPLSLSLSLDGICVGDDSSLFWWPLHPSYLLHLSFFFFVYIYSPYFWLFSHRGSFFPTQSIGMGCSGLDW